MQSSRIVTQTLTKMPYQHSFSTSTSAFTRNSQHKTLNNWLFSARTISGPIIGGTLAKAWCHPQVSTAVVAMLSVGG